MGDHSNLLHDAMVSSDADSHWSLKLLQILLGYGCVLLPGYALIKWVEWRCRDDDRALRKTFFHRFLRHFSVGRTPASGLPASSGITAAVAQSSTTPTSSSSRHHILRKADQQPRNLLKDCLYLSVYFAGIQSTLVTMGFFQERIITRGYSRVLNTDTATPLEKDFFNDAQFLVFANRLAALLFSGLYLAWRWRRQPIHSPPYHVHILTSLSNTVSSWCQYEALRYVSFPTQTVCKASKVLPTMAVGRLLRRERYSSVQYVLAGILVMGAVLFFLSMPSSSMGNGGNNKGSGNVGEGGSALHHQNHGSPHSNNLHAAAATATTLSGLVLMAGYLLTDAFTPNYQKKLLEEGAVSTTQMMFAVNAFSCLLCLVSLLQQGTLFSSLSFMLNHQLVGMHCVLLSVGSALGQVFIYATINRFGPVCLSVLMTVRQVISIVLSSIYFHHPLTLWSCVGLILVFGAILTDIYRKYGIGRRAAAKRSGAYPRKPSNSYPLEGRQEEKKKLELTTL